MHVIVVALLFLFFSVWLIGMAIVATYKGIRGEFGKQKYGREVWEQMEEERDKRDRETEMALWIQHDPELRASRDRMALAERQELGITELQQATMTTSEKGALILSIKEKEKEQVKQTCACCNELAQVFKNRA